MMATIPSLSFLRPYVAKPLAQRRAVYLRFFDLATQPPVSDRCLHAVPRRLHSSAAAATAEGQPQTVTETAAGSAEAPPKYKRSVEVEKRIQELSEAGALRWPRYEHRKGTISVMLFTRLFEKIYVGDRPPQEVTLQGRVTSIRKAGSKLAFVGVEQNTYSTQILCNFNKLGDGTESEDFKAFFRLLRRGDHIRATGGPVRTTSGELSLETTSLPTIWSPNLVPIPEKLTDEDTRMQNRHLDLIVNRPAIQTLQLRSALMSSIRRFMLFRKFYEVETPILAANSGGAVARPFETKSSSETSTKDLALRIAPELWLKRLMVGGMTKIFEMGPCFRNEGIDATHNPEFTMCEAYAAYYTLPRLMFFTEDLMENLSRRCAHYNKEYFETLDPVDTAYLKPPYRQVDFIPALESALGMRLPDLTSDTALSELLEALRARNVDIGEGAAPSLPKLLDRLAGIFLEPLSRERPIFIIHHPSIMSPLSKSFVCPETGQLISARAELFIRGKEMANMYEEENDPFEQRRKFELAARLRDLDPHGEDGATTVDENYLSALEVGMPPTGGWGCGIERLVMLFSGAKRISDCLAFGNLRHVVNVASAKRQ